MSLRVVIITRSLFLLWKHSLGILAWRRRVSENSKRIVTIIKKVGVSFDEG